jgi:hypothetical protein
MNNNAILVDPEGRQIVLNNFRYQKNGSDRPYYRCVNRACGASLKKVGNGFERLTSYHCHNEETDCMIDLIIMGREINKYAKENPGSNLQAVYNDYYQKLATKYAHEEIAENWKEYKKIRSRLSYHKKKSRPNNPTCIAEINLNEKYRNIFEKPFLQFDNQDNNNRIIIFMSQVGLEILSKAKRWHFDGTFKTAPKLFYQIMMIHGYCDNKMLASAYILLQNKQKATYIQSFTKLKEIVITKASKIN